MSEENVAESGGREDLAIILGRALLRAKSKLEPNGSHSVEVPRGATVDQIDQIVQRLGLSMPLVLAELALEAARGADIARARLERDSLEFLVATRPTDELSYARDGKGHALLLDPDILLRAVRKSNLITEVLNDLSLANGVPIFDLLGLRNLSSFVGEVFKAELWKLSRDRFLPNPHQDGYPDLMALTDEGRAYVEAHRLRKTDKTLWSPYPFGGVEVKATCGSTPAAAKLAKPALGEPRHLILTGADWKAHHQLTNNLIGLYWDFVSGLPTIMAVFYRNDLSKADWGKIVQPREGGGRTTSVSVMSRGGVKKMGLGWMVLPADAAIRSALTQRRVFGISEVEILKRASSPR